ncbi:hypothetical protein HYFRA_00008097 [Hymenoscyphus fraxineus]|uniref:Uncharacterized protein n=1 Tax=Hymenoscyphus fraxineus TaxID=746836 RepID=A0A9N9KSS0_9HELO|nr:hypothetical protein HYFRA_00008097 [Hymenoscyphus fraxineus]
MAISAAPLDTKIVPPKDHLVNGSPKIKVAHIELKTSPDACNVDKTGRGSVVICMLPPPPSMGWPPHIMGPLLVLEDMGFALEGEAETLHARGDQTDENAYLVSRSVSMIQYQRAKTCDLELVW